MLTIVYPNVILDTDRQG